MQSSRGRRTSGRGRPGPQFARQRADAARYVDDAGVRRLAQERQHRLVNGEDAEYVGLPHRAHFIEGHVARAGRLGVLLDGLPGSLFVFEMAAFWTSTSRRPSSLRMRSAAATIEARSVTSSWSAMAPGPISLAAASPRSKLRDPTSTVKPCATSSFAT